MELLRLATAPDSTPAGLPLRPESCEVALLTRAPLAAAALLCPAEALLYRGSSGALRLSAKSIFAAVQQWAQVRSAPRVIVFVDGDAPGVSPAKVRANLRVLSGAGAPIYVLEAAKGEVAGGFFRPTGAGMLAWAHRRHGLALDQCLVLDHPRDSAPRIAELGIAHCSLEDFVRVKPEHFARTRNVSVRPHFVAEPELVDDGADAERYPLERDLLASAGDPFETVREFSEWSVESSGRVHTLLVTPDTKAALSGERGASAPLRLTEEQIETYASGAPPAAAAELLRRGRTYWRESKVSEQSAWRMGLTVGSAVLGESTYEVSATFRAGGASGIHGACCTCEFFAKELKALNRAREKQATPLPQLELGADTVGIVCKHTCALLYSYKAQPGAFTVESFGAGHGPTSTVVQSQLALLPAVPSQAKPAPSALLSQLTGLNASATNAPETAADSVATVAEVATLEATAKPLEEHRSSSSD